MIDITLRIIKVLLFVLLQFSVASYVHYPTISTDMLDRVRNRESAFNHSGFVANNAALTKGKLFYYHIFARLYRLVGSFSRSVMVNSSWTKGHIDQLWKCKASIVYPPCNTSEFQKLPLEREGNTENRFVVGEGGGHLLHGS